MQEKDAANVSSLIRKGVEFAKGVGSATAHSFGKLKDPAAKLESADFLRMSLPLLGITGTVAAGKEVAEKVQQGRQIGKSFDRIMEDPEIQSAERGKPEELFNTLKQYAPSIAKDPLISASFVKGMLQFGTVDHSVVQDLMTSERAYRELQGKGKPFTTLQAVKNISWLA